MVWIDKNNISNMKEDILGNTKIKDVIYVNMYDNNYIVMDYEYLYLFDINYKELDKVRVDLLHDNKDDYDIVYIDDMFMYMDDYKNKEGVVFKYYDIYTYKLIDEVVIGGN